MTSASFLERLGAFRLDDPVWMLGLLTLIPCTLIAIRWFAGMARVRRVSAVLARTALITLLLGMLAGASLLRQTDRLAVIAVVDVSASVQQFFRPPSTPNQPPLTTAQAITKFLQDASRTRRPDDAIGVVLVNDNAQASIVPSTAAPWSIPTDTEPGQGTNLDRGLRLAASMIPPDATGRIVLFSDGVQTQGEAARAAREIATTRLAQSTNGARAAARSRVPIDVVPLEYRVEHEVFIDSVDSPPTAPSGSTVPVRVVLRSSARAVGTLSLLQDGEPVDLGAGPGRGRSLELDAGTSVQAFNVPLRQGRVHRFEAIWEPGKLDAAGPLTDTIAVNNRAESFTVTPGKGSVLLIDGVSSSTARSNQVLADTLRQGGLDVQTISPAAARSDLLWLQEFDLVILENVAADDLPLGVQPALSAYVRELGGGLIMVGGPSSFAPGGWKGSELEPLLPVKLDLPERLVTPAAAIVLIIDNSGSMSRSVLGTGRTQQDIANDGAAIAVESMDKTDLVGVIGFNSDFTIEQRLSPNTDPKATARRIRSIGPDGGTNLPPALQEAHRQLKAVSAEVKHVIVLSDGVSMGKEQLPGMVESLRRDGIRVSTIAVGDQADVSIMNEMALVGDGTFYRVTDPNLLPRVFLKAVRVVRTPQIRETPFLPVILPTGSPVVEGIDARAMPELLGLVLTQARPEPTVTLPMATTTGEPVLAYWNAGLGRVGVFTSDAHRWARPWLAWDGYARMWSQFSRTIARPPSSRTQVLTTELDGDRLSVRLSVTDDAGTPLDLLDVPGAVYAPGGQRSDVRLTQVGPGEYQAVVAAPAAGTYVVTLAPRQGGSRLPPVIGGATRAGGDEFRRLSSDALTLKELADITGGRVYSLTGQTPPDLFDRSGLAPAEARQPLWRLLGMLAVGVLLLDIATRRIAWDRLIDRAYGSTLADEARAATRERGARATATVERLRTTTREEPVASNSQADTSPALGDAEAQAIIREQAERRRRERQARATGAPPATPPAQSESPPTPSPDAAQPQGLQAAKARARRKMEE